MSTTPVKFYSFSTDLTNAKHDFSSHSFKVMLTNTAPALTNTAKANITEITAGNGYTAGGAATTVTKSNATGVETLVATDIVWTASGGSIGPFRYLVLYNATAAGGPLIAWWDYGSDVTLANTETFNVDFDQSNGVFSNT